MQLPPLDRNPLQRPLGAGAAVPALQRVVPVAPVNPPAGSGTGGVRSSVTGARPEPSPGVIDNVNPALKSASSAPPGQEVRTADPLRPGQGAEAERLRDNADPNRAAPEKEEIPPPKPLSQVLMDHLKTVWNASASAVQVEQVKDQLALPQSLQPSETPGTFAREILTYQPQRIKKNENI